jgi:hypothetical protein
VQAVLGNDEETGATSRGTEETKGKKMTQTMIGDKFTIENGELLDGLKDVKVTVIPEAGEIMYIDECTVRQLDDKVTLEIVVSGASGMTFILEGKK